MLEWLTHLSQQLAYVFERAMDAQSLAIFPLAFLAGILASLLPCVYPVIPLTVAYLGASSAKTKRRAFGLSLMYVLGMSATYAAIGAVFFAVKLLFKSRIAFGAWVSHPALFIGLGGLYLVLALWMLDVFHFTIQAGQGAAKGKPTSLLQVFLVGMTAGLIVGPCTGPVLAVVIALAIRTHAILRAIALMVCYSLGLGVLFLLIGTFSALAARRPKPGKWMVVVRNVFAAVMIVVACAFLVHAGRLWERRAASETTPAPGDAVEAPAPKAITLTVSAPETPPEKGSPLPAMTLPLLTPTDRGWVTRAFDSQKNAKPVVLVFWATWCAACREEIPLISETAKAFGDRVEIIGVNYMENLTGAQLEKLGIDYAIAFDVEGAVADACGVSSFPWMIVADRRGVIRYYATAPPKNFNALLEELVKEQE